MARALSQVSIKRPTGASIAVGDTFRQVVAADGMLLSKAEALTRFRGLFGQGASQQDQELIPYTSDEFTHMFLKDVEGNDVERVLWVHAVVTPSTNSAHEGSNDDGCARGGSMCWFDNFRQVIVEYEPATCVQP